MEENCFYIDLKNSKKLKQIIMNLYIRSVFHNWMWWNIQEVCETTNN